MQENNEKTEIDLFESEPLRRSRRRDRPVWAGVPVLLFLIFCLLLSGMFGLVAFVPLGIVALLFLRFRKEVLKLPKWLYAILFLIFGLLIWNLLANGPLIPNQIASWMHNHSGLDAMRKEPTILVVDDDLPPARAISSKNTGDSSANAPAGSTIENANPVGESGKTQPDLNPNDTPLEPATETLATPPNADSKAFDNFLSRGLKAVEDEQYAVANQNFKNAFKANPRDPRLQQLAAEFRKTADEKCQDFKSANAKELKHIPNNYYQYAASLTQTVPLKCD